MTDHDDPTPPASPSDEHLDELLALHDTELLHQIQERTDPSGVFAALLAAADEPPRTTRCSHGNWWIWLKSVLVILFGIRRAQPHHGAGVPTPTSHQDVGALITELQRSIPRLSGWHIPGDEQPSPIGLLQQLHDGLEAHSLGWDEARQILDQVGELIAPPKLNRAVRFHTLKGAGGAALIAMLGLLYFVTQGWSWTSAAVFASAAAAGMLFWSLMRLSPNAVGIEQLQACTLQLQRLYRAVRWLFDESDDQAFTNS